MIPAQTPAKKPLKLSPLLYHAVEKEWEGQKKFSAAKMPLTALAFTAIDKITGQKAPVAEALLTYVDTDVLSYRSENEELRKQQEAQWAPLLVWAGSEYNALWQSTSSVMPLSQPAALHKAVHDYLLTLTPMQLSAACVLASGFSSIVLMLAVLKKHITAEKAFRLSRLEEEYQAERWGRDEEASQRAEKLKEELLAAECFLRLLEAA